jgi:GDP-L-fucose synthase
VKQDARIYVAGRNTLIGAALRNRLHEAGYHNLVGGPPDEPELTAAGQVKRFFAAVQPEYIFVTAGPSGGIGLNQTRPAELMLENLLATAHILDAAHRHDITKLLYLGSSCSYPKDAPQALREESLMTGPVEATSAAYATAKLAGWQLCEAYRRQYGDCFVTAIPTNGFGPGDDFSSEAGHVIPALLRRTHEAKVRDEPTLSVWGTGTPRREFLPAKDLADACLFVMRSYDGPGPINLGGGPVLSIADVAHAIAETVGYRGRIQFDPGRPDGAPLKALDASKLSALGWRPATDFRTALEETYAWFLQHEVEREEPLVRAPVSLAISDPPGRGRDRAGLPHGLREESRSPVDRAGGGIGRRL